MGKREELLKECRELGITFVDDSFSLSEIRQVIENKKKEIAKAEKKRQSAETWKKAVAPEQEELLEMLESRGLDPERIQKWLSYSTSAGSQDELHHAINEDIRPRNACRERHGLSKFEKLMPLRRDIVDLYSHGLTDEWLNQTDVQDPEYKFNLAFHGYVSRIIEELQRKEREVQKAEAVKAETQTRFARLKVIPAKIITDPQSGKVRANEKYNQWIDEASELRRFLENQIKTYGLGGNEAAAASDVEKTLKSTYQLLLSLIEKAKKQ